MIIHRGYDNLRLVRPVITLGVFDGVHKGHRLLLEAVKSASKQTNGESVIITFHPHPRHVIGNENNDFCFLSTPEEKFTMLEEAGMDHVIIQEFTREFSMIGACDFTRDILIGRTGTNYIIMGHDHRFGKEGTGDISSIRNCPGLNNVRVEQVGAFIIKDRPVSSSLIREALLAGNIDWANEMLGYNYKLSGKVVEGKRLGRQLGFPTANIHPTNDLKLVPANGVYAVEVFVKGKELKGMMSIGTNPTVSSDRTKRTIEVNIFDFDEDIYGENISVSFRKKMRDERKFAGIAELSAQMETDRLEALSFLT